MLSLHYVDTYLLCGCAYAAGVGASSHCQGSMFVCGVVVMSVKCHASWEQERQGPGAPPVCCCLPRGKKTVACSAAQDLAPNCLHGCCTVPIVAFHQMWHVWVVQCSTTAGLILPLFLQRLLLFTILNNTVPPTNETVKQVFSRISALRDFLDGPQFDDQGLVNTDPRTIAVPDQYINL